MEHPRSRSLLVPRLQFAKKGVHFRRMCGQRRTHDSECSMSVFILIDKPGLVNVKKLM